MNRPEDFILTTDFATLKNDDFAADSVTFNPVILSAAQVLTVSKDVQVGRVNASTRIRMASVKESSSIFYPCYVLSLSRVGTTSGPSPYNVYAFTSRVSDDTLRLSVSVQNPYSVAMATELTPETVIFEISTFLSPFV